MAAPKRTDRLKREDKLDQLLDENDDHLQKLLERIEDKKAAEQKPESGLIKSDRHYRRTKTVFQALCDEDISDELPIQRVNGAH